MSTVEEGRTAFVILSPVAVCLFASKIEMMSEKRILQLIISLFILLGITYALVTPVFEASDELWHYPMVRHLADGNPLPVQVFDPALAGPWKQEASQPPLYYYLGAALTFWIDTADMDRVRWLNPHVDNGIITADGNINLAVHDPLANPWQGTLLAVRIVRLFSVLLGAATVYLTYLITKEVTPSRPEIYLGAAAVTAYLPMFLFISGAVNNDNLAIPLASLTILLMIQTVTRNRYWVSSKRKIDVGLRISDHKLRSTGQWLLLGVVIGLALLTKEGTLGLLPLAWGTAFLARWQSFRGVKGLGSNHESRSADSNQESPYAAFRHLGSAFWRSFIDFGRVLLPVLLTAGWWYWRNVQLYGDWLGWNAFIAVLGSRAQPATLAQLWGERWGFMLAYWGLFGGVNVPMWEWIYHLLNGVLLLSVAGFIIFAFREFKDLRLMIKATGFNLQSLITNLLDFIVARFALVVCLLFSTAVIVGLIRWATTTWSSQGRLVFTALSALCTLFVVGLVGWLPSRPARWIVVGLSAFMFVVAAVAPWVWIRPAYQPQTYLPQLDDFFAPDGYFARPQVVIFDEKMQLTRVAMEPQRGAAVHPGGVVDLVLEWKVLAAMDRDWSVFVHLNDSVLGVPIAQRDMYTRQGLRPTSFLQPGETFQNYYRLRIPETAVAPAELDLMVGLYDFANNERLQLENGNDAVQLAVLQLEPVPGVYPNATSVNFMNELELVGYGLEPRRAVPGESVNLRLYVQALRPLIIDYTIFAQVLDEDTTRWAANDFDPGNLDPRNGTSAWQPGEVQIVEMPLTIANDTPANVYPLILGVYTHSEEKGFQYLQLVTSDGRITQDNFLTLTKIRVD